MLIASILPDRPQQLKAVSNSQANEIFFKKSLLPFLKCPGIKSSGKHSECTQLRD